MNIKTPAKINTQLYILKKRKDGYHDLYTHLVPVALFDTINITRSTSKGIQLQSDGRSCGPHNENLILKAAQAFEHHTKIEVNVTFHLSKQIPVGAGLGGGSGNAAGVLQALNHMHQSPLKNSELEKMAASLGSDIPFFLNPQPSEVKGRGEQLMPLPQSPSFFLVIVKPPFSIATPEAYRHCQPAAMPSPHYPQTFEQLTTSLYNQFETTLLSAFPALSTIKQALLKHGAISALVSGSGSAVFGVFPDETSQKQAYQQLLCKQLGDLFCCHSLASHHYYSL